MGSTRPLRFEKSVRWKFFSTMLPTKAVRYPDRKGLGPVPAPQNFWLGWITLGLGFLVNCFQRFSPVLFLEEDLSWGASSIFQVQEQTRAEAETISPLLSLLPGLPGSRSSYACKEGRRERPTNHYSQEALRRRNELAQLSMTTARVPRPRFYQSSLWDYLCLFLAPGDDAMLPDWLCTGGGDSGDLEFCKPDTWRENVKSLRSLKGKKVGRFAGKCKSDGVGLTMVDE